MAVGTGLVVARKPGGSWSPPSALGLYSVGWGLQIGGSLCDLLIVLRNNAAVAAFCGALHCGFAGGVSLAVGPLGRQAEVTMQVSSSSIALLLLSLTSLINYSCSGCQDISLRRELALSCFQVLFVVCWMVLALDLQAAMHTT